MGEAELIILIIAIPVTLILGVMVVWAVQHQRALRSLPPDRRRALAEAKKHRRREGALFWIPFMVLIGIGGAVEADVKRRRGLLDVLLAVMLAHLFASLMRRSQTRSRGTIDDNKKHLGSPQ